MVKKKKESQISELSVPAHRGLYWRIVVFFSLVLIPVICSRYFQDHFTVIKWHAAHLFCLALLLPLVFRQKFLWPKLSKAEIFLGLCLFTISLGNIFYLRALDFHGPLQDRLSFLAFTYVFYLAFRERQLILEDFIFPVLLATVIIHGNAIYEILTGNKWYPYMAGIKASSFFGNTNMTAQFLGVSVLFQFHQVFARKQSRPLWHWGLIFLLSLTLAYIDYLACRSVMLALLPVLCWLSWQWKIWAQKKTALITLGLTLLLSVFFSQQRNEGNLFTKFRDEMQRTGTDNQNSMWLRLSLWESSVKLLAKRPMGIGAGNTEFNLVPFQVGTKVPADEKVVYNTPHNEYIRYMIEDGLIFTIMALALLILWIKKFWPLAVGHKTDSTHSVVLALFGYLAVESFFQFPLINAFPFVIFAMMLAYVLAHTHAVEVKQFRLLPQLATVLALIVLSYFSWANILSSYHIANHFKMREHMKTACDIFPSRWRGCLHLTQILIEEGKLQDADRELQRFLRQSPYHFVAIRLMGINQFKLGNMAKGCYHFYQYDKLFESKSSIHQDLIANCPTVTPEFERTHPFP